MNRIKVRVLLVLLISVIWTGSAYSMPARFAVAPTQNYQLMVDLIRSARCELVMNIYEFTNDTIAQEIVKKIREGVRVKLLFESNPLLQKEMQAKELELLNVIQQQMSSSKNVQNRLYFMGRYNPNLSRRYRYDHAKYIVVDEQVVGVSSENLSPTGHAVPGTPGNRGWEVALKSLRLAKSLLRIFEIDTITAYGDIQVAYPGPRSTGTNPTPGSCSTKPSGNEIWSDTQSAYGNVAGAHLIVAPQALTPMVALIRSARKSLDLQQLGLPLNWNVKDDIGTVRVVQNPLITELIEAAKRGVKIRILLNDDQVFAPDDEIIIKPVNGYTVWSLNKTAKKMKLPLAAALVNVSKVGITYLHNKGMIIDGQKVLISSINGSQNSMFNNREVGVLLDGPVAPGFFSAFFENDWKLSL